MREFKVGQIIAPDDIKWLPDGSKISISEKQYVIAELPEPELTEAEKIAELLRHDFGGDIPDVESVAEWIVDEIASRNPSYVVDAQNDIWDLGEDGFYSVENTGYSGYTLDQIRDAFGIRHES